MAYLYLQQGKRCTVTSEVRGPWRARGAARRPGGPATAARGLRGARADGRGATADVRLVRGEGRGVSD